MQRMWRTELRSHAIILACVMIVVIVLGGRAIRVTRMLNVQALEDGLTGLANRRSFDETLDREARRAERSGQPISVIMIDVDHFKSYNDRFGHPAADACLRAIAHEIGRGVRRGGDLAAR